MTTTCEKTSELRGLDRCLFDDNDISSRILPCILDIGEALMLAGADVNHVERLLVQLGQSYGARKMNVLVITASIIVTMSLSDGREYTQTRRIVGGAETDFYKLERLNKLCLEVKETPLEAREFKRKFLEINEERRPKSWHYVGGIIGVAGYTAFFGGNAIEIFASAIFAAILCFLIWKFQPYTPNTIGFNVIATAILGVMIALTCDVFGFLRSDVIIIGEIMLLIPGLAMTNSIRDMFSGDTLSGLLRFVESLLWTAAMVLGFMVSMILCGSDVRTDIEIMPYWFKMLCVIPCSIGFLIYYNSRKRLMTFGLLGALLSFGAFVLAFEFPFASSDFLPAFFCGLVAAIYSEVLSKRLHVPSAVFFVTCILPIIPGRYLFTAMNYFVHGNLELAGNYGYLTLEYSIAIAIAICLVWTISRTWRNMHLTHHMVKIVRPLDHA